MSKNSPKQLAEQLRSWLSTRSTSTTTPGKKQGGKFSKADHYKKQNNRYGSKKSY